MAACSSQLKYHLQKNSSLGKRYVAFLTFPRDSLCVCVCMWPCWVFLAVHRLSSDVASLEYSLVVVLWLLTAVASLVEEHRLWGMWTSVVVAHMLSNCGTRA